MKDERKHAARREGGNRDVWRAPMRRQVDGQMTINVQSMVSLCHPAPRAVRRLIGWLIDRFCCVGVMVSVSHGATIRQRVIELARRVSEN